MHTIGIVGGGASGLMAAIAAASAGECADIYILEHKNMAGKKILSTGNGRCNLTNTFMDASCFRSEDIADAMQVIRAFGHADTCDFFARIGLVTKSKNGYIYPRCEQASAVRNLLVEEARRLGVKIHTDRHVTKITRDAGRFCIDTDPSDETFFADRLILACGGKAAGVLGSDGSGYALAQSFGHTLAPVVPALVQLKVKDHPLSEAAGVRADAKLCIYEDGVKKDEDSGELQITDYGLSGIVTFQISRYAARALEFGKKAEVSIDFLPEFTEDALFSRLLSLCKEKPDAEIGTYLNGFLAEKLAFALLKASGIRPRTWMKKLSAKELKPLVRMCKHLTVEISGTNGFDHAQVCAGGVYLREIDCTTMESRLVRSLYLTGELLDVDGICGGYNLQWAWATGYLAGIHAAKQDRRAV